MRAVIRRDNFTIEFSGRGQTWNELLRPYLGGPEAPSESELRIEPAPASRPTGPVQLTPHRAEPTAPARSGAPTWSAPAPAAAPVPVRPAAAAQQRPAAPSQPRTWYPPKPEPQPARRFEPQRAPMQSYSSDDEDESDVVRVEPSADPATLYARLAALPGRRSERDAVMAAVWFLTKGERETNGDEVERHFETLNVFPDIKVVPHLLKHVHRTKLLEVGSNPKAVRMSKKGVASVQGRLVSA